MKLGLFTVMMSDQPLEKVLDLAVSYKLETVELGTGAFPGNAHCNPSELLADDGQLRRLKKLVSDRGLTISALSCHGNPLHPSPAIGQVHADALRDTLRLAERLEIDRIVGFAGCPAGSETDTQPNWVHEPWPEYYARHLRAQFGAA